MSLTKSRLSLFFGTVALFGVLWFSSSRCAWGSFDDAVATDAVALERAFPRLRFDRPVFLTGAGDGSGRLFVVEQAGVVRVFENRDDVASSRVFLDISHKVSRRGNEEGLIGLAFDPDFSENGWLYVHYSSNAPDQTGILSRFRVSDEDPDRIDPDTEEVLLQQKQPWRNHNGGMIDFGPDGYLYLSFGDGGSANDPQNNGQDLSSWLGAILRIDVHSNSEQTPYSIPSDNPFVAGMDGERPEIWAYGLRNVWRFSFDRETGELWAADVGQNLWEEVNLITKGGNYGWRSFESFAVFDEDTELHGGHHSEPVAEYGRELGISITGGYVYRGKRHPELVGRYFYGDYVSGNLWSLSRTVDGQYDNELVRRTGRSIASFGEDDQGELFLLSFDGALYRIVPTDQIADPLADWPIKLSDTGLFASMKDVEVAPHLIPYEVNAAFWSDGADKQRWIELPEDSRLEYRTDGSWEVPVGATIVKHFRQRARFGNANLETRLIRKTESGWEAATYVWDRRHNEATLAVDGQQFEIYSRPISTWHAPSSSECASCHVAGSGFVLGLTTAQLNRELADGRNQIESWGEEGWARVPSDFDPRNAARFVDPHDENADLESRARVWLDVNCAMCHQPNGPGNANIDLRATTELDQTGLVDIAPAQGDLGLEGALLLAPGSPEQSLLWHRVNTLGDGRMPNVASNRIDRAGADLLRAWIESTR